MFSYDVTLRLYIICNFINIKIKKETLKYILIILLPNYLIFVGETLNLLTKYAKKKLCLF